MDMKHDQMIKINDAVEFIRQKTQNQPAAGIILGTGLGGLAKEIEKEVEISYQDIPNFPISTVESHSGKLLFGKLSGKDVVAMQGRFHFYEGYTMRQITFPVRVMRFLGVQSLFISNACGSLNPYIKKSEIMLIDDYINLLGDNPLIGINDEKLGPRFPDMSEPYSKRLMQMAEQICSESGIKLHKGVYAAMKGPMLETRAEYRFLRTIGADAIGMSTIPETIAARHMNMDVLGLSIITDECYPDNLKPVSIGEILSAAAKAEPNLTHIVKTIIGRL